MFGSVVWEEPTVWVNNIAMEPDMVDENIDPVVPRETRHSNNLVKTTSKSKEHVTSEKDGQENCIRNTTANGNRRKSDRKPKQNETASIVDVIDKNGGRRKSIMV